MLSKAFGQAVRHPTSYVFLFVLVAGLVMAYARAAPPLSTAELALLACFSLVYLFVGTVVFMIVLPSGSATQKIIYLAFQISLGLLILVLSRGNGWLVMLPLASQSVALFSPREAIVPCVIITLGIAWNTSRLISNWIPFLQSALVFGSAVFFAAVFTNISIRDARRREEIERLAAELEATNLQLQEYAAKVEELSIVEERNRLAREIHDGLGHYLSAMNLQAQVVSALMESDPPRAQVAMDKMQVMVLEALADIRRSVAALRSDPLLGKNVLEAIEPLVVESRNAGLVSELFVSGEPSALPPVQELTLYRAVQEGLTNVRKHAQAIRVDLFLDYRPDQVSLRIQDDGVGSSIQLANLDDLTNGFGLFGLRERVQIARGKLDIHSAPGQGFCLEIRLPIQNPVDRSIAPDVANPHSLG